MINWHDWFVYDETSPSCLRWKVNVFTGRAYTKQVAVAGEVAGTLCKSNYWQVGLCGKTYRVNRVVWEMHEKFPLDQKTVVDHENRVRSDNKIANLRATTSQVNARNSKMSVRNKSGVTGVSYCSRDDLWRAHWKEGKSLRTKSFSCSKFSNAFQLACEYRQSQIERLNTAGAGYTEQHGTNL